MSVTVHDGLLGHPKFLRFASSAGIGPERALFALLAIWSCALRRLDEVIGDAGDVERVAGWEGEEGRLAAALLEAGGAGRAGLLEVAESGLLAVHDLWDWAPDPERKRRRRKEMHASAPNGAERRQTAPNGAAAPSHGPLPPVPSPSFPSPDRETPPTRAREGLDDRWEDLQALADAYPEDKRGVWREVCQAWRRRQRQQPPLPELQVLLEALTRARASPQWTDGFVPKLARFVEELGDWLAPPSNVVPMRRPRRDDDTEALLDPGGWMRRERERRAAERQDTPQAGEP